MSLYEHTILYIQKTDLLTRRKQVRFSFLDILTAAKKSLAK